MAYSVGKLTCNNFFKEGTYKVSNQEFKESHISVLVTYLLSDKS